MIRDHRWIPGSGEECVVIVVHRLDGEEMVLNADLVESVEATPDTVITLVDGRRIVVREAPEAITERVIEFRAAVLASAENLRVRGASLLRLVRPE